VGSRAQETLAQHVVTFGDAPPGLAREQETLAKCSSLRGLARAQEKLAQHGATFVAPPGLAREQQKSAQHDITFVAAPAPGMK
jgi:hypothetical protein